MARRVSLGVSTPMETFFLSDDNVPEVALSPVSWKVFDFNNALVVSGSASQDVNQLSRWYANITVPSAAIVSDEGKPYTIKWTLISQQGKRTNSDSFELVAQQEVTPEEDSIFLLGGEPFSDSIRTIEPLIRYSIKIVDPLDVEVYSDLDNQNPSYTRLNSWFITSHEEPALANIPYGSEGMYMVIWSYEIGTGKKIEVHPLHVANYAIIRRIADLRLRLDKGRYINPVTRFTDNELFGFLNQAMLRFNNAAPQLTSYTLGNLPFPAEDCLLTAASYQALLSLYLEEGYKAFDFSGQAVQLNVDRTQYIQTVMAELNSTLDEKMKQTKLSLARAGTGIAHLNISIGPATTLYGRPADINRWRSRLSSMMYF